MDGQVLIEVSPPGDIVFTSLPRRVSQTSITLINRTNRRKAFKIKTTAPKSYLVKPNQGILEANDRLVVELSMQSTNVSINTKTNDKFQIQAMEINDSVDVGNLSDAWKQNEARGVYIQAIKLKVQINVDGGEGSFQALQGSGKTSLGATSVANTSSTVYNEFDYSRMSVGAPGESAKKPILKEESLVSRHSEYSTDRPSGDVYELRRKLDEALATVADQERMLLRVSEERNQYFNELNRLQDTSFKHKSGDKIQEYEIQQGFTFAQMLIVAVIGLLLGVFLSTYQREGLNRHLL